ncbi:hypothetical protein ACF8CX_06765 [Vibrio mimicus]
MARSYIWLLLCCWFTLPAYAGSSPYLFSLSTGFSRVDNPASNDEAWVTQFGYNYQFSPFIGLDMGYSGMIGNGANMLNNQQQKIDVKVEGFYFGAFMGQPINNITVLYARGGLARMKVKERYELGSVNANRQLSGTNPYIGIGTKVQSSIDKSLALTMELNYQSLEQDYSSLSFTVGGQYRF